MFYIERENEIKVVDESRENIVKLINDGFLPNYSSDEIQETEREIIYFNNKYVFEDEVEQELTKERKQLFLKDFFNVPEAIKNQDLYYRKIPKGYSSAVESINTAFNIVATLGNLPTGSLIFYEEPDFTKEEECTEEWLVNHQVKNEVMTPTEFGSFYAKFITSWNSQEHES